MFVNKSPLLSDDRLMSDGEGFELGTLRQKAIALLLAQPTLPWGWLKNRI